MVETHPLQTSARYFPYCPGFVLVGNWPFDHFACRRFLAINMNEFHLGASHLVNGLYTPSIPQFFMCAAVNPHCGKYH